VLQAAVHVAQRTFGFIDYGTCDAASGFVIELDVEHPATG
jgi:hypothetical protein